MDNNRVIVYFSALEIIQKLLKNSYEVFEKSLGKNKNSLNSFYAIIF